eukprot:scaffold607503_cov30-Prasinocladus_malaysianus.AAC.1
MPGAKQLLKKTNDPPETLKPNQKSRADFIWQPWRRRCLEVSGSSVAVNTVRTRTGTTSAKGRK